ncbi:isoleucine--tRNA ligase [Candidatus Micrarchaeota archaeon]|nr:isoleucine--tRNA ligase [Candidatus Micrarchaeota archaeon]
MKPYDQKRIEAEILEFWEKNRVPQNLSRQRPDAKPFYLLDGPPYANADAHVGHVKTTASKDIWSRYMQMKGFSSFFQPGFDCHGLPTEVMVEKELGIKNKQDIEKIGIQKFDAKCLEKVVNTEKNWMAYYRLLGAWRFYSEPYFTYKDYYIESGWWTLKQMEDKGLLTRGQKSTYWCPHCETSLSGYEVSDSYKDLSDPSIYIKFKLKNKSNEFLLVWTTTPWTLASNVSVIAHPKEKYVRAQSGKEVLVFGEKRLEFLKEKLKTDLIVLETFPGKKMDQWEYEPVLDVGVQRKLPSNARKVLMSIPIMTHKKYKKHKIKHKSKSEAESEKKLDEVTGTQEKEEYTEFVNLEDGTGLVHCAPGHGQTDHFVGKHYQLPSPSPLDEKGRYTDEVDWFKGQFVKKADPLIVAKLDETGHLLHAERVTHRVALCWRCKSQLIFRLSDQWYLSVESVKGKMLEENEQHVKWMPPYGKEKFHNWLVDREDWCISQQRYWGIPLPIWVCSECGDYQVIGSRSELVEKALGGVRLKDLTDLHRHTVDAIQLKCSRCKGSAVRIKDILNVWFDSGIAPWASLGYPFKNKELFERMFPANLINESQDQIRGWFDSLMFASVGVFGKTPYLAVAMNGWVLDEKGEKMSKSLGNVVPARDAIEQLSADVIRMYYCFEIAPWEVQKFSFRTAGEVQKAFTILYNTLSFYETYAQGVRVPRSLDALNLEKEDAWIISRLESVVQAVTRHMDAFERHLAGRSLVHFAVNEFSRVYIKLVRDRVSLTAEPESRKTALAVMRYTLLTYSKLLAPISPFLSEFMYRELNDASSKESVHYEDWPKPDHKRIKRDLENVFVLSERMVETVNAARQEMQLKRRWPVQEIVFSGHESVENAVSELQAVLMRSCNALSVRFSKQKPSGMHSKEFKGGSVFVPKTLTPELEKEAFFRELVRAIQDSRKKNKLQVQNHVELTLYGSEEASNVLKSKIAELKEEVGASKILLVDSERGLKGDASAKAAFGKLTVTARFRKL